MSFSLFCLFLILLQNTEQLSIGTIETTTYNTSSHSETTSSIEPTSDRTTYESRTNSRNIQSFSSTEPISDETETTENTNIISTVRNMSDRTTNELSTNLNNTQDSPSIKLTTEESTENSNSNSMNTQSFSSSEPISRRTTENTNTNSTVGNTSKPPIQPKEGHHLEEPSDISNKSENRKSNQQENKSYEKNLSTASVFGIVLAAIVGTVVLFYIIVSLIKNYKRKSYIVRSPSMELGQT